MRFILAFCTLCVLVLAASAQVKTGEVVGTLSGTVHKYNGEFSDDMFGPGGYVSLQYAPHSRIILEPRFGYGSVAWKINPSDVVANPKYFGSHATLGDLYPGTSTLIKNQNRARFYTVDALFNYVVVKGIPAVLMLTGGVGYIDWEASTKSNQVLPNALRNNYQSMAFTMPVGASVRIPFSERVGLLLRLEHRFVFSHWLDDIRINGSNDAITSGSIGLTYRFTEPPSVAADWAFSDCTNPFSQRECCQAGSGCDDEWCCGQDFADCEECTCCASDLCYEIECCCSSAGYCCHCCCHCCCTCCCKCNCTGQSAAPASQPSGEAKAEPTSPSAGPASDAPPEPAPPGKPGKKFSKDIRFKLDTDEFDFSYPQTQQNLDELLDYMKSAPEGHEVIIEGHASGEGPPQRNKVLSDIRAKRIRSWLLENGVEPSKIRGTVGYGSSMPRVMEPTPEEARHMTPEEIEQIRAQNRRIEVYVQKDGYDQGS